MIVGGWGRLRLKEVLGSTKTSRKGRQGNQNQNNQIEDKVEKSFLFKKHPHCGQYKIEPIIKTNTKIHIFGISKHLNALSQKPT